jgi:basic secretory peptidase family protein/F5/8 type C domain-containing protein
MRSRTHLLFASPLLCLPILASCAAAADAPVAATVETTLTTAGGNIRQFAFDGDDDTFFASDKNAAASDHFTLVFDRPVAVKSVTATTGRPSGGDALEAGVLQVSADGKAFEDAANFADGKAKAKLDGRPVRAVRIKPTGDLKHPLVIREVAVESDPAVAVFKYPVEFVVDVSDAPDMKEWADKAARICEREYPLLCEDLKSDGWKPSRVITMTLKSRYRGVAATGGDHITGSVRYFKSHPDDFGAMIHETVHTIQGLRGVNNPGWLIEGVADYERFFKYEPGQAGPVDPDKAHYDGSYRVTATFLDYVSEKYDKELVSKLNAHMRAGDYSDNLFKDLTGKTLKELDDEWRESLRR